VSTSETPTDRTLARPSAHGGWRTDADTTTGWPMWVPQVPPNVHRRQL